MNKDIESRKKGFSVVLLSWGAYNAGMPTEIAHPSVSEISLPLHPLAHDLLATFTRPEDIAAISDAITFATKYHGAQKRNTGEPQMVHPLRAMIAAREALGDHPLIVKLLQVIALHDTIEDTAVRKRDIHHIFGRNVAWAVDRLSKRQ